MTKKDGSSQCREKVVAQLQSFEIEAKTKAMNETAYQQTRISYDEKITLLEAARQKCSERQAAEQKLADLQNTEQEKWCSTFRLDVGITCTGLIVFITLLFAIIIKWDTSKERERVLYLFLMPLLLLAITALGICIFFYTENHRLGRRVPFLLLPCVLPCRFSCGRPDI